MSQAGPLARGRTPCHGGQDPLPWGRTPRWGGKAQEEGLEPSSVAAALQPCSSGVARGRGSPWGAAKGLVGYGGCLAEDGSPSQ